MPWFNVDDGFANSKPVLKIPRRYRCAAVGLWTLAGSWSAKELTDGFIPDHALEEFAGTPAIAEWLVRAGLWRKVEEGWQFEGWAKWQKTKERVLAYREREAEKKRNQRGGDKPAGSKGVSPGDSLGTETRLPEGQDRESPTRPGQPLPTPSPKPIVENLGGELTSVDDPEPPRFCSDHPDDTNDPCIPCRTARKVWEAWDQRDQQRQASAAEAERNERQNCPRCEGTRFYIDESGDTQRCDPHVKRAANA